MTLTMQEHLMTETSRQAIRTLTELATRRDALAFYEAYRAALSDRQIAYDIRPRLPSWSWEAAYTAFAA